MSKDLKTAIKYWFWLLIGISLISMQVYKYFTNTLVYDWTEAFILFLGLMFMIKPTAIPDYVLKTFGKKQQYGKSFTRH
ncbi:hypothetical protein LPB87_15020 [Flavobacterium sp. EDS]|uniref:hypothetical protein n=1 Tax=Flavobacterium sp. EDS TaxID=2897328 RepID=UPI001E64B31B|nr:hypothetical protein [Flavobacterium sp. EDS]MCD0475708.1 hypothetical protein [Flavobacterium sp. EDS]